MNATAIPATRRPGWEPDTDVAVASLSFGESPVEICPRNTLVRAVDAWRAIGSSRTSVTSSSSTSSRRRRRPGGGGGGGPAHRVYGTGPFSDPTGLLITYYDLVEAMDLGLEGVMAEFSPGQMEINLRYGPALDATDRAFVCREMVREVAAGRGYRASFMGRPDATMVGADSTSTCR